MALDTRMRELLIIFLFISTSAFSSFLCDIIIFENKARAILLICQPENYKLQTDLYYKEKQGNTRRLHASNKANL